MQGQRMGMSLRLVQKPTITIVQLSCRDFSSCHECLANINVDSLPKDKKVELHCCFTVKTLPLDKTAFAKNYNPAYDDMYF